MVGRVTAWARAGALRHGRLCGARRGARRAAGGRGGSHDPARRGGSGSARCVRGLAGPQPAQRLPRAIPAPQPSGKNRGVAGGSGRDGARRWRLGHPLGGGTARAGPRPLGRGGRSLGRRLGPGRGVERASGLGAVFARLVRFLSRWDAWESIPPTPAGGTGAAPREERRTRRTPATRTCWSFAGTRRCSPGPAASDCGWDFYFSTSGKPITPGNAVYCDREVIVLSVDWGGNRKTRVTRSCVK